jgi:holo-[acyl-carrier protein] synthase
MSIVGVGIDLVDCDRIENSIERFGERFLQRVFTAGEIAYSQSMKFPARHFAARFAAKEALSKAFGTGIGKAMSWRDLDVRKKESGEPFVVLSGGAERLANERGVSKVWITLSHTETVGMATIILES